MCSVTKAIFINVINGKCDMKLNQSDTYTHNDKAKFSATIDSFFKKLSN